VASYSIDKQKTMKEFINYIKDIRGYFLSDRRLISYVSNRPGNRDLDMIREKIMAVANHNRIDYFISNGIPQHIKNLEVDQYLTNGDLSVVCKIAQVRTSGNDHELIEFASKYCAAHYPELYPLWNNHSLIITRTYCKENFLPCHYAGYSSVVQGIKLRYNMDMMNFFDISKFFWIYQDYLISYFHGIS
jgi:hypothetical protein